MSDKVTITTFEWVPDFAQGYVRDIRPRWALEEIGRPYEVDTVPGGEKIPEHFARQPFGQVPILKDGDLSLFESGAILFYLGENTPLMPTGQDRIKTVQWLMAGQNSVEPFVMQWQTAVIFDKDEAAAARFEKSLRGRLQRLEQAFGDNEWLVASGFTIADIYMADVLRGITESGFMENLPKLGNYVKRATARPAFIRAMKAHMAHWKSVNQL